MFVILGIYLVIDNVNLSPVGLQLESITV